MIRLILAPEPASFEDKVRKPGQNVLALLLGKPLPHKMSGQKPSATKKIAGKSVRKQVADFPYWTSCLDELYESYRGICAYYCYRIERTSGPGVDHVVAKSNPADPSLAYEWTNFRLACAYANTCKNQYSDVLDPVSIEDGWFCLDVVTLLVSPSKALDKITAAQVKASIERLKLNDARPVETRKHALEHFRQARVNLDFLEQDHPFLAKELRRQGITSKEQLVALPTALVNQKEPEQMPSPDQPRALSKPKRSKSK